jgi:hypothetical protein
MRIEPVYLLAPEPDRRVKLSRRAFLGLGLGFAAIGGGAGFVLGRASMPAGGDGAEPDADASQDRPHDRTGALSASESKQLQQARAWATGEIETLARYYDGFVLVCTKWPDDPILNEGLARLAKYVVATVDLERRRITALTLVRYFGRFPSTDRAIPLADLRRISRG